MIKKLGIFSDYRTHENRTKNLFYRKLNILRNFLKTSTIYSNKYKKLKSANSQLLSSLTSLGSVTLLTRAGSGDIIFSKKFGRVRLFNS